MAVTFTIEAHPSDPTLVLYRAKDGATQLWVNELPANDWQALINRAFPVTDTRDSQVKTWAPNAAQQAEANGNTLRTKAQQALATNATYLAIANPTAAQNTTQAKALTRQVNGLIRLMLNQLDSITDS